MSLKIKKLALARAADNAKGGSSNSKLSLVAIEELFIEKLSEKYKITERDIQRAFKRFDKDNSGYLDKSELAHAIHLFLNGVGMDQVQELVSHYDVDGDGVISLSEFTQFLISRNSANKNDWLTVDHLASKDGPSNDKSSHTNDDISVTSSNINNNESSSSSNPQTLKYKAQIFLSNLKAMLMKRAMELRLEGKIPLDERLSSHLMPLAENTARAIIAKAFNPYASRGGKVGEVGRINFTSFYRVLSKFVYPGSPPLKENILRYIFDMCGDYDDNRQVEMIDSDILIDIIFDKGGGKTNQFGFVKHVAPVTDTGRPTIGNGPFAIKSGSVPLTISDIPFRLKTKHGRTAIATPSNFDTKLISKSCDKPSYGLKRNHVFGLNINLYSGDSVLCLPQNKDLVVYTAAAVGVVHNIATNQQQFFDGHTDDITCMTLSSDGELVATGQMGKAPEVCIWESCLLPNLNEFGEETSKGGIVGLVLKIGKGFFSRGVCAVAFSNDSKYISAIGCDDKHSMGIWSLSTGELISEMSTQNGIPPQIKFLSWAPTNEPQLLDYITKGQQDSQSGPQEGNLIVTSGSNHLKFWLFTRPSRFNYGNASLLCKTSNMGSKGKDISPTLRCHTCVVYVNGSVSSRSNRESIDVITGGDNGYLYRWRNATCVAATMIIPGGICTSKVDGDIIYCGGNKGLIKMVDHRPSSDGGAFIILKTFSTVPTVNSNIMGSISTPRGSSGGSIGSTRPVSANNRVGGGISQIGGTSSSKAKPVGKKTGLTPKPTSNRPLIGDHKVDITPVGTKANSNVLSLDLVYNYGGQVTNVIAATGFGRFLSIDPTQRDDNGGTGGDTIFNFHFGPLWGLCVNHRQGLFATCGDDRYLCIWSIQSNRLVTRIKTPLPIRCCDFSDNSSSSSSSSSSKKGNSLIAIGCAGGGVIIYVLNEIENCSQSSLIRTEVGRGYILVELKQKKDCKEDISDIKFSPNSKFLAVGSHDNFIDIYGIKLASATLTTPLSFDMKYLKRLRGHSSYITHLDWSYDNNLIQSTCGSYEILYWDVTAGKQLLSSMDSLEADTKWNTQTCVLGFPVMGIWPPNSDGTDINAVDTSNRLRLVATGDDFGQVNLFNYPCIVKDAGKKTYKGHSSHVMNLKILDGDKWVSNDRSDMKSKSSNPSVITVGGNDNSCMTWDII